MSRNYDDLLRSLWGAFFLTAVTLWVPAVSSADSDAFRQRVQVGRPPRPLLLQAVEVVDGLELRAGPARLALPLAGPHQVETETVQLTGGGRAVIVRVRGAEAEAAAVLSRPNGEKPTFVWWDRTDLHGDPGERRAGVVRVEDRTDDGMPDLIVATVHERVELCGVSRPWIEPHAIDPRDMRLKPVLLDPLPHQAAPIASLLATSESPGPRGRPLVRALRFVSASSGSQGAWVGAPDAPRQLTDRDLASAWVDSRGGGSRGAFVTARWDASQRWPIRALAIIPAPAATEGGEKDDDGGTRPVRLPRRLWLLGSDGQRIEVRFPEAREAGVSDEATAVSDAAPEASRRWWIVPEQPLAWDCLSLVVAEGSGGHPRDRVGFSEIEAYTDLDFGGGLPSLLDQLRDDGQAGEQATHWLTELGEAPIAPLRERFARLDSLARRRSVRVFIAAAKASPQAREALKGAGRDADAEVRDDAIGGLADCGGPCAATLAELVDAAPESAEPAALALARIDPRLAMSSILSAEAAMQRPVLRDALATAAQRLQGSVLQEIVETWVQSEPGTAALAAAALALVDVSPSTTDRLIRLGIEHAQRFEDRYRLVLAARQPEPQTGDARAVVDGWLKALVQNDHPWMLKTAALDALAARKADVVSEAARHALEDTYPRVRAAAVQVLADHSDMQPLLVRVGREDEWPLVRLATVTALAEHPEAVSLLLGALGDPAMSVRTAAIEALAARREPRAAEKVIAMIESDHEWPSVVAAGIAYVETLCLPEARSALLTAFRRGMRPNAWQPDVEQAAAALRVLAMLGGEESEQALKAAALPSAPGSIQVTASHAGDIARRCERQK